ncbi:hypothetical protein [Yersinia enterocolitica]|uniref:hypothetical protein n=1 Tax=Yersinia enterocolitica TaxID=630 RepID=UPI0029BF072A|nr:hypothetical protein [Yersinia enterocolitica]EKN5104287.1 hypothetical protein [Yersinia enterocolitica]EKN6091055.1 hypothetical protein [Yersinia enterocolitica]ELX2238814.1 hypothetical protein [Yersinia enterocolitica]ELY5242018.1 hypothetical protein [Yersinia enterocolitica]
MTTQLSGNNKIELNSEDVSITAMYIKSGWEQTVKIAKINDSHLIEAIQGNEGNIEFSYKILWLAEEVEKLFKIKSVSCENYPSGVFAYEVSEVLGEEIATASIKEKKYIGDFSVLAIASNLIDIFLLSE